MESLLSKYKPYGKLKSAMQSNLYPISVRGLSQSAYIHQIKQLSSDFKKIAIMADSDNEAMKLYDEISQFTDNVRYFPCLEICLFDSYSHSHQLETKRLAALYDYIFADEMIFIFSVDSSLINMANPAMYLDSCIALETEKDYDYDEFIATLTDYSYERVDIVETVGQFTVKGGIIDIFPITSDKPVRIEFFGDEVYSIRKFECNTQRSVNEIDFVEIRPAKEGVLSKDDKAKALQELELKINNEDNLKYREIYNDIKYSLIGENYQDDLYKYTPVFSNQKYTIFDYISDAVLLIEGVKRKSKRAHEIINGYQLTFQESLLNEKALPEQINLYIDSYTWQEEIAKQNLVLVSDIDSAINDIAIKSVIDYDFTASPKYYGDFKTFVSSVKDYIYDGFRVELYFASTNSANNIINMLIDDNITSIFAEELHEDLRHNIAVVYRKPFSSGFISKELKTVVITEYDIFNKKYKRKVRVNKNTQKIKTFSDIEVGDYIVHETHGIGKYTGIYLVEVSGEYKDMIKLEYKSGDFLYVPVDRMKSLHKYIGADAENVKVDSLSSGNWKKLRNRARKSIKNIAGELIKLYSIRESQAGYAFSADDVWQQEFEEAFLYTETDDQLRCIDEIKKDMEKARPMDRLLCGDVGFGKTEVALRAIFKAVNDSKQAAFLVPTTILAEQHYNTIVKRFKDFPVNIEVLSRFKTKKQQEKIVDNLRTGVTDIVVGTHRLLSKDIKFKDLGLLVIDEEQRFGVTHKEKIKNLKHNVDTLTLSATPIPRTLNMSLMKVRDLSIIEDPPENRYPIQTYVLEYDESVIRNAILREMSRRGQVYFVHNRVDDIDLIHMSISNLVPEARIVYAHGQMTGKELENIIIDFMNYQYDVLISTTIIETGVDIPNVNTIIINRSDTFGLSQLYQLRGRVGRSDKLAYAYLTYQKGKILSKIGEKKLAAIKEFTDLGSGFKLSMRDLEIRGAGNLFGSEQHGHLVSIGYELYLKILKEEIEKRQGLRADVEVDTKVEFKHSAYISDDYIADYRFKIDMYKKISSINSIEYMKDVKNEMKDRFGDIPTPVLNLINISTIRWLASENGFAIVQESNAFVKFIYDVEYKLNTEFVKEIIDLYDDATLSFESKKKQQYFIYKPSYFNDSDYETEILYDTIALLKRFDKIRKSLSE